GGRRRPARNVRERLARLRVRPPAGAPEGSASMSEMDVIRDAEERGRTDLWPLWRRVYAQGDPLPKFTPPARPAHRFDEGDVLPEEYESLLLRMLRHEGERAGNKSFLGLMGTCLDLAEALFPSPRQAVESRVRRRRAEARDHVPSARGRVAGRLRPAR